MRKVNLASLRNVKITRSVVMVYTRKESLGRMMTRNARIENDIVYS